MPRPIVVTVRPAGIARALLLAIAVLGLVGYAGQFSKYVLRHDYLLGLVPLFDLDGEGNVPTWFTAILLLLCSVLCLTNGAMRTRHRDDAAPGPRALPHSNAWLGLASIFAYMSVDEACYIHELLNAPVRQALGQVPTFLYYAWVIPGAAVVLVVGLAYARFLFALPDNTRRLVTTAGAMYAGAALLFDLPESAYAVRFGTSHFGYAALAGVEETVEMLALTVFVYAVLQYQASEIDGFWCRFEHSGTAGESRAVSRDADDDAVSVRDGRQRAPNGHQ